MNLQEKIWVNSAISVLNYPWSEHRDLIGITVNVEDFYDSEEYSDVCDNETSFIEFVAVVDKEWLFEIMNIENPRKYLQEEYTGDESFVWFNEAIKTGHLAMLDFNLQ